jgi:hypothetical protein
LILPPDHKEGMLLDEESSLGKPIYRASATAVALAPSKPDNVNFLQKIRMTASMEFYV